MAPEFGDTHFETQTQSGRLRLGPVAASCQSAPTLGSRGGHVPSWPSVPVESEHHSCPFAVHDGQPPHRRETRNGNKEEGGHREITVKAAAVLSKDGQGAQGGGEV